MKRFITNQPAKQNVRKIARGPGLYKPYGLNRQGNPPPGNIIAPGQLLACLTDQGWTPDTSDPTRWYFPQVDAWLTLADVAKCDFSDLPRALARDVRACIRAQGFCQ